MAPHSSILTWRIPRTEKPDGLHIGLHRVRLKHTFIYYLFFLLYVYLLSIYHPPIMPHIHWLHVCLRAKSLQSCLTVISSTVTLKVPLSMEFSRQDYWGGLPCHPPGHLPDPGIEPKSPISPALADRFSTTRATGKPIHWLKLGISHNEWQPLM